MLRKNDFRKSHFRALDSQIQPIAAGYRANPDAGAADRVLHLLEPWIRDKVRRFVSRTREPWFDVEEEYQTARLAVFQALGTYDASRGALFRTWAHGYVRGLLHELAASARRRSLLAFRSSEMLPKTELSEDWRSGVNVAHVLDQAISRLTAAEAYCIRSFYLEGVPVEQLAKEAGLTWSAIWAQLKRSKKKLRGILSEEFGLSYEDLIV